MMEVSTIGLDLAKHVFQAHGASASGMVVFRKKLRREQVLSFFASQPRCRVAMEACASAHHWARVIGELGHEVRLISPAYVKPFVKRQKNDTADAEAICEAAQRPTMRFVAVKSEEKQASSVIFRTRDLLVSQRTQIINALRGHLGEYGFIAPQGPTHVERLTSEVEDPSSAIPRAARTCLLQLVGILRGLQSEIAALDAEIAARAKRDDVANRLMTVPGHRHSTRSVGTTAGNFQVRARLCGLDWLDTFATVDRREAENGTHFTYGRAKSAAAFDHSLATKSLNK
jgi:transposase